MKNSWWIISSEAFKLLESPWKSPEKSLIPAAFSLVLGFFRVCFQSSLPVPQFLFPFSFYMMHNSPNSRKARCSPWVCAAARVMLGGRASRCAPKRTDVRLSAPQRIWNARLSAHWLALKRASHWLLDARLSAHWCCAKARAAVAGALQRTLVRCSL